VVIAITELPSVPIAGRYTTGGWWGRRTGPVLSPAWGRNVTGSRRTCRRLGPDRVVAIAALRNRAGTWDRREVDVTHYKWLDAEKVGFEPWDGSRMADNEDGDDEAPVKEPKPEGSPA
jgi:hypothetical protein